MGLFFLEGLYPLRRIGEQLFFGFSAQPGIVEGAPWLARSQVSPVWMESVTETETRTPRGSRRLPRGARTSNFTLVATN
jgi:hypothetical protein